MQRDCAGSVVPQAVLKDEVSGAASGRGLMREVVSALDGAKAQEVVEYDATASSCGLFDHMVICTAGSDRHARALADAAVAGARRCGVRARTPEVGDGWLLLDMGLLIVHIMSAKSRAYYDLEGLWAPLEE